MTTPEATGYRIERDSMGEVEVPAEALWRAQTQRAVQNFPISGRGIEPAQIRALAQIKGAAAEVNGDLGVIDPDVAAAIAAAAAHVAGGGYDDQFPVDVFQTGSGTSSNMNTNEVIATLAGRELGRDVHPNDDVNASQSSNDVFPSSIHLAATEAVVAGPASRVGPPGGRAGGEGRRVRDGGQGRAYPPDGRHPGHPRAGVRRLRGPGPVRHRAGRRRRCPGWPSCRWAERRSAPGSTPRSDSPPG